ncbi:MAG: tetratricopeptide repeat protein [Candidatus Omnitrophica bacterium]|nr:tetratricopeptide repeat protein [Candidatus Omnitrophota bacterium]MCA9434501.1 tetratricopeptide repeat protein [Candidatus Omnitrophota bacterium]
MKGRLFSMLKSILTIFFAFACLCSPAFADVIWFSNNNRLDGHVVRRSPSDTNFKLLNGSNVTVENPDITRTDAEPYVVYLLKRGEHYLKNYDDPERALRSFQEALRLKPGDPFIQERIDWVLLSQRIQRCKDGIEEAREKARLGNFQESIDIYEKLLPTAPRDELARTIKREVAETYAQLAYKFFDHSYFIGAEQMLRKAEEYNPNSPMLHFVLGRIYHMNGDYKGAEREYTMAMDLAPDIPKLSVYLADVRKELRFIQNAPIEQ